MTNLTLLSASQAFHYQPDDIRLSYLSMTDTFNAIQRVFEFRSASLGTPRATFGPVELTNPPGLQYEWGQGNIDNITFPIRLLTVDNRRVVWEIAGAHTEHIDGLMSQLLEVCSLFQPEDGNPTLGPWQSTSWFSELSFTLDESIARWKEKMAILKIIDEALYQVIPAEKHTFPSIYVHNYLEQEPYPGDFRPWHGSKYTLSLRQGTTVGENTFYSSAPLTTHQHITLIDRIEQFLKD
jgi:hypothetical protein